MSSSMKALNYKGPFQVKVEDVEAPKLEHPDDIIVKVTTVRHASPTGIPANFQAAICGSDLQ